MKKAIAIIMFLTLAVMAVSASALEITAPTLGDDDQDRRSNVSATFTVKNDGTSNLTGIAMSTDAASKYNVRFEPAVFNLTSGSTQSVTIKADIPLDFDAVVKDKAASNYLEESAFAIGKVTATAGSETATTDIKMQAVNQLKIDDGRIECTLRGDNTGPNSESIDDGDKVEKLKPDMNCVVTIEAENRFNDDDDEDASGNRLKIGDIEMDADIRVEIDDRDFDVDEDEDIDGLDAEEKDEVNIDFEIDEDVDDGNYNMYIYVEGKDENGAIHGEKWKVRLEIDRLTHDVQIRSVGISPTRVSACEDSILSVSATLYNMGKRDEDEAAVELDIPQLKITKRHEQIDLEEDDKTNVRFTVEIPKDTKAGVYRANINTFFDRIAPSNTRAVEFTVEKCEVEEEEQSVVVVNQTQPAQTQPTTPATGVAVPRQRTGTSSGFTESPAYLWLLGGLAGLLLIIVIVMIAVAFRRPRQPQF